MVQDRQCTMCREVMSDDLGNTSPAEKLCLFCYVSQPIVIEAENQPGNPMAELREQTGHCPRCGNKRYFDETKQTYLACGRMDCQDPDEDDIYSGVETMVIKRHPRKPKP